MADTDTDTEPEATKRANRQYDWFTSQFGKPSTFGFPIGEPTFESEPVAEERAPGVGERAPGPGERRAQPGTALPAPADFAGDVKQAPPQFWGPGTIAGSKPPEPAAAEAPTPWTGPPPWSPAETPNQVVKNRDTGERWMSDGDGWSQVGRQTASTGEPGESGGLAAGALAALTPGGAGLPGPADEKAALETPEGGWDPTATAPDAALAKSAGAPKAPSAAAGLGAEATQSLEKMKHEQALQEVISAAKAAATEKQRKAQTQALDTLKAANADYVAYLERTKQPVPPELKAMPKTPDVKIRPWLDPEGKDALTIIGQTLGMLAITVGAIGMKAPITAMQYFREAAENWRRDEVDAANGKMKQFEMQVQTIKGDNEVALKQYEIADKQYAHNVDAKKALVLARLDGLGLEDKALELTNKPYDEALASSKTAFDQSAKILDEIGKLGKVNADLLKLQQDARPKNIAGAEIILADTNQKLAAMDQAQTPPTDPARVQLQREHDLAEDVLKTHQTRITIQNQEAYKQKAAGEEIKHASEQIQQANFYERRIEQLADAYTVLHEEKALPTSRTSLAKWIASAKQHLVAYSPRAQGAIAVIERVMNPATIGIDRTYFNEKGNVAQKAWGKIDTEFIPYPEALSALSILASVTHEARTRAQDILTTRVRMLGQVGTRDFDPAAAPEPE